MKKNVLWVSPYIPYDAVPHAGGKTHNFYLKEIHKSQLFDIHIISTFYSYEKEKIDLDRYGIANTLIDADGNTVKKMLKKLVNIESTLNPLNRYKGVVQNYLELTTKYAIRQYAATHLKAPDIVILEWTQVVLLSSFVKKLFPRCKIIAMEEDVTFLGYERKWKYAKTRLKKIIARKNYVDLKRLELAALSEAELIILNNKKDKAILRHEGFENEKLMVLSPYFDNYNKVNYKGNKKDILFFGAMSRPENYLSAIWFIENVFHKIPDTDCNFVVIGNNPPEKLLKYQTQNIKILGFVEKVEECFSNCLCLVAPLVLGAGIKIKILEAFSAGLPILTNTIGIEGIPAQKDKDFFFCENPQEYLEKIQLLINEPKIKTQMSENAKKFIDINYNLNSEVERFIAALK